MRLLLIAFVVCCSVHVCSAADIQPTETTDQIHVGQNCLLGPLVRYFRIEGVPRIVDQISILDIPMISQETYSQYWYRDDRITSNPLAVPKYQDMPLFLLFKRTKIRQNSGEPVASRTRLFQLPFGISLYANDSWPDHSETGLINVLGDISIFRRHAGPADQYANEYLRLPIIGPLFASWHVHDDQGGAAGYGTILPRLTQRKAFNY